MKVNIHKDFDGEEHVELYVRQISVQIEGIITRIRMLGQSLLADNGIGQQIAVAYEDIYYLETVENTIFVYLSKGQPLQMKGQRLVELETELEACGFARISKTTLVNLDRLLKFYPAGGGRQIAVLDNGEEVLVSRLYTRKLLGRLDTWEENI